MRATLVSRAQCRPLGPQTSVPLRRPRRHVRMRAEAKDGQRVQEATPAADGPSNAGSTATPATEDVAAASSSSQGVEASSTPGTAPQERGGKKGRSADSTDWVATQLTRRFGLRGGLVWLGILAVGSIGEQIKTRMEYASEQSGSKDVSDQKETVLPSGVKYTDLRVGGGQTPQRGLLILLNMVAKADGVVFEDTVARQKPIVFLYGARPFTGGLCKGVEEALANMRVGGRRRVVVPPELGFGSAGTVLRPTEHAPEKQGVVPGGAVLEYELELVRVSIPPS